MCVAVGFALICWLSHQQVTVNSPVRLLVSAFRVGDRGKSASEAKPSRMKVASSWSEGVSGSGVSCLTYSAFSGLIYSHVLCIDEFFLRACKHPALASIRFQYHAISDAELAQTRCKQDQTIHLNYFSHSSSEEDLDSQRRIIYRADENHPEFLWQDFFILSPTWACLPQKRLA